MTQEETAQILAVLKAAYPNSYKGMTKQEAFGTVTVWYTHFADLPVDIVMMAVQKCIGSSVFPPSVFEVKDKVSTLHWEAYEAMRMHDNPSPEIRRVYDLTQAYRNTVPQAPSLQRMIDDRGMLLLENR